MAGGPRPITSRWPTWPRTVTAEDDHFLVSGAKYYATGSLYADWLDVLGRDEDGDLLTALGARR